MPSVIRMIAGTVVGYLITAFLIMIGFTILWSLLGAEVAFEAGTTRTTLAWGLPALALSAIAALLGGLAAARIGGGRAVLGLAALMIVFGALSVSMRLGSDSPVGTIPEGRAVTELSSFEAASVARAPLWFDLIVPLVGASCAALGGRWLGTGG